MAMKKKVCMIAHTVYEYDNRVRREAEALIFDGEFAITLLSLKKGDTPRKYTLNGVEIIELSQQKHQGSSTVPYFLSYLKFTLKAFFVCSRLFLKRKFDVIHVHNMPNCLVFSALVPWIAGKTIVLDLHDQVPEMFAAKFKGPINKVLSSMLYWEEAASCWFADRVICVNQIQMDVLVKRGIPAKKISIFLNVPDPSLFNQDGMVQINKGDHLHFKLVYHGTLAKRLGIDLIIKALAKLIDKINKLELYIIGGGDDQNEFEALSKKLNLTHYIHFLGSFPLDKLSEILRTMDLGIIANRKSELTELMLPVKLLEYFALGIPAVVPRLKAIEYYFHEDMVCYYEPDNIDALAKAILEMQQSESRRSEKARMARTFLDRFGWEKHRIDFINYYKQL